MSANGAGTADHGSRGRIDKRRAIVDAAFTVFARAGYEQASVQDIADEAGVAKPTVYNHFPDKDAVLTAAVTAAARTLLAENLAVVEQLRETDAPLEPALRAVATGLQQVCGSPRAHALRRITYSQLNRQPELIDIVQARTWGRVAQALADRLACLSLAGRLRPLEPAQAAEQLLALLSAPIENRSRLGSRPVPAGESAAIVDAAVDTFLRAYHHVELTSADELAAPLRTTAAALADRRRPEGVQA
ncbi:TetR/AcrR family transcriptional regulator [Frankia sp. AgB32]|uniref:TetR/AcrR family transcriptional regulator n=1 Tax=Frankia sp. AgB32 TaxID=631119 RepID=UPI00200E9EE1|nr:TetR/AcrR family transcriptional regulator [Frankia sp. AgB32]MCK9895451.1 TetR/AcrR family transcriptional regulator [Frankia sp. AgB32]